jgi:TolB protein
MRRVLLTLTALAAGAGALTAQDAGRASDAIRIGITYRPGTRPGLVVVPGPGLDSVRAIVARDLDFSDRFQMIEVGPDASAAARSTGGPLNYGLFRTFGADQAVEIVPAGSGVTVRLHDLGASRVRNQQTYTLPSPGDPGFRLAVHRIADEVTRWAGGTEGYAASRILYLAGGRIYRIDSDGADDAGVSPSGEPVFSPAWSPDGSRIAYTRLDKWSISVMDLATRAVTTVPGTENGQNITPAFSPDGRSLAYAHMDASGTNIFAADIAQRCCVQRLTVGRFADNLSPTYSPDGRRVAFVSTRAGPPQIYVMGADGTDQELLASFDFGSTGPSNAPEWSPDGASVVFHREVSRSPQIFILDVASQRVKQLTSVGRNEDPTWAPDGRHVAFISDRTGRRQIWIVDTETGRVRQLSTAGAARLPSWSRRLRGAGPNP